MKKHFIIICVSFVVLTSISGMAHALSQSPQSGGMTLRIMQGNPISETTLAPDYQFDNVADNSDSDLIGADQGMPPEQFSPQVTMDDDDSDSITLAMPSYGNSGSTTTAPTPTPEPGTLLLLGFGLLALLGGQRLRRAACLTRNTRRKNMKKTKHTRSQGGRIIMGVAFFLMLLLCAFSQTALAQTLEEQVRNAILSNSEDLSLDFNEDDRLDVADLIYVLKFIPSMATFESSTSEIEEGANGTVGINFVPAFTGTLTYTVSGTAAGGQIMDHWQGGSQ